MESFEVGDLIEAIPPWALACGSGRYSTAVLVSVSPFVAVSEQGDMMWNTTIKPEKVRRIGKALPEVFAVAMNRYNTELERDRADAPQGHSDETHVHKCNHCGLWWTTTIDAYECCSDS